MAGAGARTWVAGLGIYSRRFVRYVCVIGEESVSAYCAVASLPLAVGSSPPTSGAAATDLLMSSRATPPSAADLLTWFGIWWDDEVCHGDVVLNLEVWAHSGGVGDTMAEGTGPSRKVSADSMEIMDICHFAGSLA